MSSIDWKEKSFGALPSPEDERDWIFENLRKVSSGSRLVKVRNNSLPSKVDHTPQLKMVFDQGVLPICAAAVAVCCKEWQESASTNGATFSPMFVYNHRSNYPKEGMHGRDVVNILKNMGCCRNRFYETNIVTTYDKRNVPPEAIADAKQFTIANYARVTTLEGLKKALYRYGPCYIAFPMYHQFSKQFWMPQSDNDTVKGGHAVTVVGYDDKRQVFKLRNSWSILWGEGGYTYYPYQQFRENRHWEVWSMVDGVSPNVIPPEPKCRCVLL